jgi:hypothetical protein
VTPDSKPTSRAARARSWRPDGGSIALALLIVLSASFATATLVDAVSGLPADTAEPTRPPAFLIGAPLFGVWDSLSLLTASQHYAVVLTLVAAYILVRLFRLVRLRAPRTGRGLVARATGETVSAFAALGALLAFYAAGLLVPRPMVGIELTDPELISVDFHSHTMYSHDGWGLFTARRNRAWHEGGGFDVGYVTDHYTWRGVDAAAVDNPERVGERTVLLSGAEIRIHRRPTNILGDRWRYLFALDSDSIYMEPDSLRARGDVDGKPPTLLYTMPGQLQYVVPFSDAERSGVIGIEINDGSPRGLEQVRRDRKEILALADSADLAVVAAANLHGWGRTVAAWSVMRIPGWQEMTPEEVGDAIEAELHAERRASVDVVERRMPYHGESGVLLALTLPRLAWEHFRMLSPGERLSWLLWLGLVGGLRARMPRPTPVEGRLGTGSGRGGVRGKG